MERGLGTITSSDVEKINTSKYVEKHVVRINAVVDILDKKLVGLPKGSPVYKDKYPNAVEIEGVNSSELSNKFRSVAIKLSSGRHLTKDYKQKVLVHETFARKNNLKMGDKFRFKTNTMDENRNKSVETVELEIVGMFTRKLNSYPADGSKDIYNDASFFTHSASQLNDFIQETKKNDVNWRKYELLKN